MTQQFFDALINTAGYTFIAAGVIIFLITMLVLMLTERSTKL